jgi:acyl-coenzyme A synthetase/AMP-(fatty) acid ligase
MRTVYGNHERFETTYFKKFPGYYCTGDGTYPQYGLVLCLLLKE